MSRQGIVIILIILEIFALSYIFGGITALWLTLWAVPLLILGFVFLTTLADHMDLLSSWGQGLVVIGICLLVIPYLGSELIYFIILLAVIIAGNIAIDIQKLL